MVHYKLTYFNLRGRAELSRLILHQAGVSFEDHRFGPGEWPTAKPNMPFGQVPVLEVDGKMLAQSITIARYLARENRLAGETSWDQAIADQYVDCLTDLAAGFKPFLFEKDLEKKKEMFDKYYQDNIKAHLEKIEAHLAKNGTGFLVGNAITWADLAYFSLLAPMVEQYGESYFPDSLPHLHKLVDTVANGPLKSYFDSNPKTAV